MWDYNRDCLLLRFEDEKLEITKQSLMELELPAHLYNAHPLVILQQLVTQLTHLANVEKVLWEYQYTGKFAGVSLYIVKDYKRVFFPTRP